MKADGSGQKRLTTENGYDGGTFFTKDGRIVWRHFEENGLIANVWTMKPDGTDKKQITDFGVDELGAVRASVGRVLPVCLEQARLRELRSVHGGQGGIEGAGAHHLHRRLRRPAGAVTGRHAAGVDVEPRRRHGRGGTDLSRAVES